MEVAQFKSIPTAQQITQLTNALENEYRYASKYVDWFLEMYDPATNYELIQQKAAQLKNPQLLELVISRGVFPDAPQKFIRFMRIFAAVEGYEEDIYEANGVVEICNVMKSNLDNIEVQTSGCKALASLALDDIVRELMNEEGCIEEIIKAMRKHNNVSDFVIEACKALINISFNCDENKDSFGELGGVSELFHVIEGTETNDQAKAAAITALRNLCNNDVNKLKIIDEGGVHKLAKVMKQHIKNATLQINAIWCMLNLAYTSPEYKRFIGEDGGIEAILRALKFHKSQAKVQKVGAIALLQLARLADNRVKIGQKGGLTALITVLKEFPDDESLTLKVLQTLERLCLNEGNRVGLAEAGGIPELINIITKWIKQEDIVTPALTLLYRLSLADVNAKDAIKENGGVTVCVNIMNEHKNNNILKKLSSDTMSSLFTEGSDSSSSSEEEDEDKEIKVKDSDKGEEASKKDPSDNEEKKKKKIQGKKNKTRKERTQRCNSIYRFIIT